MLNQTQKKKIVLIGNPNVGKSVIFASLTGKYVTVSNYPGTTVEIARGSGKIGNCEYVVVDTPGMYSLLTLAEDERVARSILFTEQPEVVIQVADAKNLERMLHFTLQLIEAEIPLILDLNLMDEAERAGITIDVKALEKELGIPVVATVATENQGIDELKQRIAQYQPHPARKIKYDKQMENIIQELEQLLKGEYKISRRAIVLLLLQDDAEVKVLVKAQMGAEYAKIEEKIREIKNRYTHSLNYIIALARQKLVNDIVARVSISRPVEVLDFRERLSRLMINPFTGIPILLLVIYILYEFVGVFGAMISVGFIEEQIFGKYINPLATQLVTKLIPVRLLQELFVFDYGILTLGIRYAIAIILPIVTTFFIAFSIIEDTGYLPRLALLIDRLFKGIGLNGRAVIPIVLGFGCDTMATLVTRTLETRRERIIATFLLALAVPCSAQLGVIFAL
ncbi:MAG: ferrous iron transport protein B, partial [Candidatus Sumerlaeia bacterium]|nr:ferrous iron transport protein B [Candidatus Sumerlaeia bacterium]